MPVGLATETDTALAVAADKSYPVGLAVETDTALSLLLTIAYTLHLLARTSVGFEYEVKKITELGAGVVDVEDVTATMPINWMAIEQ